MNDAMFTLDTIRYIDDYMYRNIVDLIREGRRMLRPPSREAIDLWAEKHIYLENGPYRADRTPHAKYIFEAVMNPEVREITIMGSSQIAKTTIINIIISYLICERPSGIIMMQPTEGAAADYAKFKLNPMIENSPYLSSKIMSTKSGRSKSATTKVFPGGFLRILTGLGRNELRGKSVPYAFGDDIDGIPFNIPEGDVIERLKKRTTSFPDYLFVNTSTPTLFGSSRIEDLYETSNMIKFHVPCPGCGQYDYLRFENLIWEKNENLFGKALRKEDHNLDTVRYVWKCCGYLMNEGERMEALQRMIAVPEHPQIKDHYGFWINELSSTLSSMRKVANAIINAGDKSEKLQSLYNTTFGLSYKPKAGKSLDPIMFIDRIEDYLSHERNRIPNGVLVITMSVDVQQGGGARPQRLEVNIWGYGKGEEAWLLYKVMYPGNLKKYTETWEHIDRLFFDTTFTREDGIELRISRMGIDTGFETETVYEYIRSHGSMQFIGTKGANNYGAPIIPNAFKKVDNDRVCMLYIGTQAVKEELFARLEFVKEKGPRYIHFPKLFCDGEYFKQLTSEEKVEKDFKGGKMLIYEKKEKQAPNEQLDLFVYCYAVMRSLHVNFDSLEKSIENFKADRQGEEKGNAIVAAMSMKPREPGQAEGQRKPETQKENFVTRKTQRRPGHGNFVTNY